MLQSNGISCSNGLKIFVQCLIDKLNINVYFTTTLKQTGLKNILLSINNNRWLFYCLDW